MGGLTSLRLHDARRALRPGGLRRWRGPAGARSSRSDSDAPVDITADELEVVNAQCLVDLARLRPRRCRTDTRLRADVLQHLQPQRAAPRPARHRPAPAATLIRMRGRGQRSTTSPRSSGCAATRPSTTPANETIVVTGDVVAVQGKNVLRGDAHGDQRQDRRGPDGDRRQGPQQAAAACAASSIPTSKHGGPAAGAAAASRR